MPLLVHITAHNVARRIQRSGIAPTRWRPDPVDHPEHDRVVWAFPVLASYTLTHAWSRELKRWGRTSLSAVTFRIGDDEPVYVRHFSQRPIPMAAAPAVGQILSAPDPRGYEILVPRRVGRSEIVRVRDLPEAIGWRYWSEAKGRPPQLCDCPVCSPRGEVNARRDRERVARRLRQTEGR